MFQNRYYYNTLFLRYINPLLSIFIPSIYPEGMTFVIFIGKVLQKIIAYSRDRVTEISDNIFLLFDYEVFMPYIDRIYTKRNIQLPYPDNFDTSKALNCKFPNFATLFSPI